MIPRLWIALVVLAVLNPFCCHLLPYFQTQAPQAESILVESGGVCAGKSEALRERQTEITPVLWVPAFTAFVARTVVASRAAMEFPSDSVLHTGPPRHKLFAVFLL
jgi:hypothetical protein